MALELLFGPVNVARNGVQVGTFGGGLAATYVQGLGLLGVLTPTGGSAGMYAVQLDGSAFPRSSYSGASAALIPDLRRQRGLVAEIAVEKFYTFNAIPGQRDEVQWLGPPSVGVFGQAHAVVTDRFLQFDLHGANWSNLDDAQTWAQEYAWSGSSPGGVESISVAGPTELCVAFGTGSTPQIRFYDFVAKKQSRPTLFVSETHQGVWYVPKWDLFVELKSRQLKILANAIHPASISTPAFSPSPTAGEVSTVSVTVLGAQSEPCVGELIDWTITAGGGSLSATQSTTDSSGHASVLYIAPTTLVGSVTIQAQLSF
jgi:hypothetical protein